MIFGLPYLLGKPCREGAIPPLRMAKKGAAAFGGIELIVTFALESSQGIRVEGMTTLSRQLDSIPKVSVPGWLFLLPLCNTDPRDFHR